LNAVNVAVDNKTQQKSAFWVERLQTTLNSNNRIQGDDYVLLQQKSMVGLLICVFVRRSHIRRVSLVQSQSVGVGVLGMGGNKGGVSVRLQFYDSTICFICSHLAAHRENVTGRNNDFANVLQKTSFDIGEDSIKQMIRNGSHIHHLASTTTDGFSTSNVSGGTAGTSSGGGTGGPPSGHNIHGIVSAIDHDVLIWLG
jgi:inositol polyphosphate 5-phosphatase INPP5B/F